MTRLLKKCTASMEQEKQMVARLQTACGRGESTTRLERIINDYERTDEEVQLFNEYLERLPEAARPELEEMPSVRAVTLGLWYSRTHAEPLNLPPVLMPVQSHFEAFFRERRAEKIKLNWCCNLGDVEIVGSWGWGGDVTRPLPLRRVRLFCHCFFTNVVILVVSWLIPPRVHQVSFLPASTV